MRTPLYTSLVSRDDRLSCMQLGVTIKHAEADTLYDMNKSAGVLGDVTDLGTSGLITVALMTGIPLGIVSHMVGQASRNDTTKERDLKAQIGYYDNATKHMENSIGAL